MTANSLRQWDIKSSDISRPLNFVFVTS